MVSQCIIRNWCGARELVEYFDLRNGPRHMRKHVGQIMYRSSDDRGQGFVPVAYAPELERCWTCVENRGCKAIRAVECVTSVDEDCRQAILALMALHLLRSSEVLSRFLILQGEIANKFYDEVTMGEEFKQVLVDTGMPLHEAEDWVDAAIRAPDGLIQGMRKTFAENLSIWLDRYQAELSSCGLILRKSERALLMLGDGPAFMSIGTCMNCETTTQFNMLDKIARCRLHSGVSAFWPPRGWHCWMPLSPQVVAQASPRIQDCDEMQPCFESQIEDLNRMQCQRARFRVVVPVGSERRFEPFVRQHGKDKHPKQSYKRVGTPLPNERWKH